MYFILTAGKKSVNSKPRGQEGRFLNMCHPLFQLIRNGLGHQLKRWGECQHVGPVFLICDPQPITQWPSEYDHSVYYLKWNVLLNYSIVWNAKCYFYTIRLWKSFFAVPSEQTGATGFPENLQIHRIRILRHRQASVLLETSWLVGFCLFVLHRCVWTDLSEL